MVSKENTIRLKLKENLFVGSLVAMNVVLVWQYFNQPFPYVFSAPLIPVSVDFVRRFGADIDSAARMMLFGFYIFGPTTLYYLVRNVTGRRMSAAFAAVLYSLPIFRARLEAMTLLGDGAHIASLTVIPLAVMWYLKYIRTGKYIVSIIAGAFLLLVSLISPFGFFVLLGILAVITFSEMLLGSGRTKAIRLIWVILVALGFSAFWYNPSFIQANFTSTSGRAVVAAVNNLIPISFVVLPVLATFGYLIFDKRAHLQPLFIALGMTILFGLISFAGGLAPFAVSAQRRYLSELLLSLAFLWGVVGTFVYDMIGVIPASEYFPVSMEKRKTIQRSLVILMIVISIAVILLVPFEISSRRGDDFLDEGVIEASVYEVVRVRSSSSTFSTVVGYGISGLTVLGLVGLYRWVLRRS